ncbi:MAG: hypothetical protein K6U79_06130 [Firmicutes bacterium]|nr:hypothetical protein [Bacillota bacterium]
MSGPREDRLPDAAVTSQDGQGTPAARPSKPLLLVGEEGATCDWESGSCNFDPPLSPDGSQAG